MQSLPRHFVLLLTATTLIVFGCDSLDGQKEQQVDEAYSPEAIAKKHNEGVSQAIDRLQAMKERQGADFQLDAKTVQTAVRQTKTVRQAGTSFLDSKSSEDKTRRKFENFLVKNGASRGVAHAAAQNPTPNNLHRAGFLSESQMEYINEIRGLEDPVAVRKIMREAGHELGDAGTVVQIFAATYANSIRVWKKHRTEVRELADGRTQQTGPTDIRNKDDVDWAKVVFADAAGSLGGAALGALSALANGAATASLTFGPQGVVLTITGSAVSGAVKMGVGASVATAAGEAYFDY